MNVGAGDGEPSRGSVRGSVHRTLAGIALLLLVLPLVMAPGSSPGADHGSQGPGTADPNDVTGTTVSEAGTDHRSQTDHLADGFLYVGTLQLNGFGGGVEVSVDPNGSGVVLPADGFRWEVTGGAERIQLADDRPGVQEARVGLHVSDPDGEHDLLVSPDAGLSFNLTVAEWTGAFNFGVDRFMMTLGSGVCRGHLVPQSGPASAHPYQIIKVWPTYPAQAVNLTGEAYGDQQAPCPTGQLLLVYRGPIAKNAP